MTQKGRPRKTSDEQFMSKRAIGALLYAAREVSPLAYFAFACQYLLALRIGEVICLRYDHMRRDHDRHPFIMVPTLKKRSGMHRDKCLGTGLPLFPVPVLSHVNLIEAAWDRKYRAGEPAQKSPWLFPVFRKPEEHWSRSNAFRIFHEVREAAGLPDYYSPHALRHSAATYLHERCDRQRIVSAFLRHDLGGRMSGQDSAAVTARYIHITEETWRKYRGALDLPTVAPL